MSDLRTTPELDNFTRANENPLSFGGKWSQVNPHGYAPQLRLVGNNAIGQSTPGRTVYSSYWNPSTFDGDMEVWARCAGFCDFNDNYSLGLLTGLGGADADICGYVANWETSIGNGIELFRQDNGVNTLLELFGTIPFPDGGDLIILRTRDDQVETFQSLDAGATWQLKASATDTTYRTDLSLVYRLINQAADSPGYMGVGGGTRIPTQPQFIRRPWEWQGVPPFEVPT